MTPDADQSASRVVEQLVQYLNERRFDAAEAWIAPDAVNHAEPGSPSGVEVFRAAWERLWTAFPDWTFRIDETVSSGELVANRYTNSGTQRGPFAGHDPTGRSFVAGGIDMVRVRGGLVREHWAFLDLAAMADQLEW
jgi:predicted ester cyclase